MTTVTDFELMQYLDGELSAGRHEEVDALLEQDEQLAAKLDALAEADALLGEGVLDGASAADDIAASVMAEIQRKGFDPRRDAAPSLDSLLETSAVDDAASPVRTEKEPSQPPPVKIEPRSGSMRPLPGPAAANDNQRAIFGLAAVAAAAAALVFWWGGGESEDPSSGRDVVAVTSASETAEPPVATTGDAEEPRNPTLAKAEELGVEVASVNFGASTGAIFYVSSGDDDDDEVTPVVWLSDD